MVPSEVKILDFTKTKEIVFSSQMKVFRAYRNKFFADKGKQGAVLFHIILATGIVGYSLEYKHLSK